MTPRIQIWRPSDAPKEVRSLYDGPGTPLWIAVVPRKLSGPDLDDVIVQNQGAANVSRYIAKNGDVVYVGIPTVGNVLTKVIRPNAARLTPG